MRLGKPAIIPAVMKTSACDNISRLFPDPGSMSRAPELTSCQAGQPTTEIVCAKNAQDVKPQVVLRVILAEVVFDSDRDHVRDILKLRIKNVGTSGINVLQPEIAVHAVITTQRCLENIESFHRCAA
jgi:hypothetical protein